MCIHDSTLINHQYKGASSLVLRVISGLSCAQEFNKFNSNKKSQFIFWINFVNFEIGFYMKISDILSPDVIEVNLDVKDKTDSLKKVIDLAAHSNKILDLQKVTDTIFEREKLVSTGVGKGFAIPHGKTDAISDIVAAFITTKNPIDFDSIDGEPVRFIFLLVGKETLLNTHIKLLSRISRLMNKDEFRAKLLTAKTKEEVMKMFKDEEKNYFDI